MLPLPALSSPPKCLERCTLPSTLWLTGHSTDLLIKKVSTAKRASASLSDSFSAHIQNGGGRRTRPHVCPHNMRAEEDQHACHLCLPFAGPCRVSTPLRRGGNGEEARTCGVCTMDQILLQRSRDEHTSARLSAERIPSHLSVACAEACDIVLLSCASLCL